MNWHTWPCLRICHCQKAAPPLNYVEFTCFQRLKCSHVPVCMYVHLYVCECVVCVCVYGTISFCADYYGYRSAAQCKDRGIGNGTGKGKGTTPTWRCICNRWALWLCYRCNALHSKWCVGVWVCEYAPACIVLNYACQRAIPRAPLATFSTYRPWPESQEPRA